jgi:hypothetical protein
MGSSNFYHVSSANDAKQAFTKARDEALYDHGHSGYSGTIAEKGKFVIIPVPQGTNPYDYANKLMEEDDPRISDKWGPAGCIEVEKGKYLFFGWASS